MDVPVFVNPQPDYFDVFELLSQELASLSYVHNLVCPQGLVFGTVIMAYDSNSRGIMFLDRNFQLGQDQLNLRVILPLSQYPVRAWLGN